MHEANRIFDFIEKEFNEESKQVQHYQIVAYQIMRLQKSTVGGYRRSILDTIYVRHCNQEHAKKRAINKASLLGNCCVIELAERIIGTIMEKDDSFQEDGI